MTLSALLDDLHDVPANLFDESVWDSFLGWCRDEGITLYPHQEESGFAALAGDHVIVATPTGSGKSLVAIAAHFIALAKGQRSFYTAPIKALVSEKFFALCEVFGADKVGMMTGDATVNAQAPIMCATAEIVANMALRDGKDSTIGQVVMDEFHYYSDPSRGWAWQVPLLELPNTQFVLMSATLGDVDWLVKDLKKHTGKDTTIVTGATRPVPLSFEYVYTPLQETIDDLLERGEAPIYVVHFTQKDATEHAQSLTTTKILTPEEQERIREEIGNFKFTTTFGKTLSSLVRRGIGVHHAGMLPKYRRLVEKLSQTGLLKIICGTDTLGVGINVPIRTVLMTGLAKFDGSKHRILKSREFHQIAGRAGRAGYDTHGNVVIQAPEHEIENYRARQKAGSDPKKLKKIRKKAAAPGQVTWTLSTYERLTQAEPEELVSQFKVSTALLLNMLTRPGDGYEHLHKLLRNSHNTRKRQNQDILTTIELFRGLEAAGIVQRESGDNRDELGRIWHLVPELEGGFALDQPLAPFALAALDLLDPEADSYTLDIISVIESILEDPRMVLIAQERARRSEEMEKLKAEGVEFNERRALVEEITWPQPLAELLEDGFDMYAAAHPWVKEYGLKPKSVLREMIEKGMTFSDLIATYQLARAEGVVLRYLTDAWRTLSHSVPQEKRTEELDDIIVWLKEVITQVDSSLVDEWALMQDPDAPISEEVLAQERAFGVTDPNALTANRRAFTIMIRNLFFRIVQLFADEKEEELAAMFAYLTEGDSENAADIDQDENALDFGRMMDDYFEDYDDIDTSPAARGAAFFHLEDDMSRRWRVRQILKDPEGDNAYAFEGVVDLDASDQAGEVRLASLRFDAS